MRYGKLQITRRWWKWDEEEEKLAGRKGGLGKVRRKRRERGRVEEDREGKEGGVLENGILECSGGMEQG